uniref:Uncharacterized protein n=1 Tax=Candidatus Kentrum sp. FW TaxID=2126338 RepID=A0A450U0L4_9GAMM|nr:MAG: hypothetical protein BECKFW1821C_GA0114237_108813 [Candidatus Kentron sp. FW]
MANVAFWGRNNRQCRSDQAPRGRLVIPRAANRIGVNCNEDSGSPVLGREPKKGGGWGRAPRREPPGSKQAGGSCSEAGAPATRRIDESIRYRYYP